MNGQTAANSPQMPARIHQVADGEMIAMITSAAATVSQIATSRRIQRLIIGLDGYES